MTTPSRPTATATVNPCRLCAPLGACLALKGVEGAVPVLHGSQGCATYIRRYLVSHFREPMDVASSSFGEQAAIFGGEANLTQALDNVIDRYHPTVVGVATTCLAETIGDDVKGIVGRWLRARGPEAPRVIHVSTPAYAGSHAEGFSRTVLALVQQLAAKGEPNDQINLMAPMAASPADLRALATQLRRYGLTPALLPDWSTTLDGGMWGHYEPIAPGGTPLTSFVAAGSARATLSPGLGSSTPAAAPTPGRWLSHTFGVPDHELPLPVGLGATDAWLEAVAGLAGRQRHEEDEAERGRLLDAMVDAHKVLFERRIALVGEVEAVVGLARWCSEVGLSPVLCASGAGTGPLGAALSDLGLGGAVVLEDTDHDQIASAAAELSVELVVGPSKVRSWARKLELPVVHLGFPIHDRIGAARLRMLGYDGALQLLDRIVNALLEHRQEEAGLGWAYL